MGQSRIVRFARRLATALSLWVAVGIAQAVEITDKMSLLDAIDSVRSAGYDIAYSSQIVKPWMRVRSTPVDTDPLVALREVLNELSLQLRAGPGNRWLIVSGPARNSVPVGQGVDQPPTTTKPPLIPPPLEEVVIVSSRYSLFGRDATSDQFLTGEEIRLMPHIADDAFRAFHRLPGVAANDFQAPFNLRGGAVDEVKVVLDGLELLEPFHMRTLFSPLSIVDPGIIGQAQLLSGGFTTEYGNHMSGVIDISSTQAGGEPLHQLGVSFVNAFARSRGDFASGRGSYQVSGRRGFLDLIADAVTDENEDINPRYSDIFASSRYVINDSVEVAAHVLSASDNVEFVNISDGVDLGENSSLDYAWLTVDVTPTENLLLSTMIFAGGVETVEEGEQLDLPFEDIKRFFSRDIGIWGLQSDLSWKVSETSLWKIGMRYRNLEADFDYHIDSLRQTDLVNNGVPFTLNRDIVTTRKGKEYGLYAAYRLQVLKSLSGELGLRWDKQTYTDTGDRTQISPRINVYYQPVDRTEIRLGWGRFHQPQAIQDLDVPDGVTRYFPAQLAEHRIVGLKHRFGSGFNLQLDIYEKRYSNLRPRFEVALDSFQFASESNIDRVRIDAESARSRGAELTLHKRQSAAMDWWLNYTWSETEDVINGVSVARSWDQRHALTANLIWRGKKWSLSMLARYHSGWPRTPLVVTPNFDNAGHFIGADSDLLQRNSQKFEDYSRVDLRLSRTVTLAKSGLEFYLEIFNLFDTKNQCCTPDHEVQVSPSFAASPNFDDYLPFFPSFGFVWTFGPGVN